MINIYNIDGSVLMQVPVTKEAKREEELSKSDYISLSFNAAIKVVLPVGSYIEYTYYVDTVRKVTRQFLLLEPYEPTQSDEMSWKYTPEFHHPKMILGKVPFYINTKNSQNEDIRQTNWSFVGTPDNIMGKVCDFLNKDIKFGSCLWKAVVTDGLKNSLNISFADNDVLSALSSIANAVGDNCEWHIDYDNETIYLGKVIIGKTTTELNVGENVGITSLSESKENYYNSFTVFGGTRNITQVNNKGENISSGDIRLQLSIDNGSIIVDGKEIEYTIDRFSTMDLRQNKVVEPLFTKVLNFSDVYPSLDTYVYNVRGRKKYVLDSTTNQKIPLTYNADGSVATYKTFTVWYMRLAYYTTSKIEGKKVINTTVDDGVTHYWYDFEITDDLIVVGKTLSCSFEPNTFTDALSSSLAGQGTNGEYVGFELKYHKKNISTRDTDDVDAGNFEVLAGDYEIIYQDSNGLIVPTNAEDMLIPRGEELPTLRCNITVLYNIAMSDIYKIDAQQKLLKKAIEEIKRLLSDLNNYTCKSYPQVFQKNNPRLQIGQYVTYKDGQGYNLETRVLKLSTNIDYDFIQEITVGNQAIKGTITQLKEDVQSIIANGGNANTQGNFTVSQLNNLIAQYGSRFFLSKTNNDTAQGLITFVRGLTSNETIRLLEGAQFGESFADGQAGFGGKIDGRGVGYLESLTLRSFLEAPEYRFNRISIRVGNDWRAAGGGIIENVEIDHDEEGNELQRGTVYLHLEDGEIGKIAVDDICQGIWHDHMTLSNNSTDDYDDGIGNFRFGGFFTSYFRIVEVMSVDGGINNAFRYVLRSDKHWKALHHPASMMQFVAYGNFTDKTRQSSRYSTLTYERYLKDVNDWEFTENMIAAQFGDLSNLSIFGLNMTGYSAYLNNIYMSGTIQQFVKLGRKMHIDQSLGGYMAPGEIETVTVSILDGYMQDHTEEYTFMVERDTGDTAADDVWNAMPEHINCGSSFKIAFEDLHINPNHGGISTLFHVTADNGKEEEKVSTAIEY